MLIAGLLSSTRICLLVWLSLLSLEVHGNVLGFTNVDVLYQSANYTGVRGVFQLMQGKSKINNGLFNFLYFATDETKGVIGLISYANSSKYQVQFSIWNAVGAEPNRQDKFVCNAFGDDANDQGYQCYKENFHLTQNGKYHLDVELENSNFVGYLSYRHYENKRRSTNRTRIGTIKWSGDLHNIVPLAYRTQNYVDRQSCLLANELVAVNWAPIQYKGIMAEDTRFDDNPQLVYSNCTSQNIVIAVSARRDIVVYFSRPTRHL
ncbi:uncharacterized protein LOC115631853 [Scaptodrosophila lebanonensis]|uniref:Uncharacterized protein LOC115631853 n=1 Tax=Drosophila lebanonensis TaxID=7225 RepID=A0A6J2U894_DROLE|nr:uncharacterized protein LOC115631853 [Scaptodrosophila lebanonensis]